MKNRKAFTLIEILIVVVVIAILLSIAIPRFRAMQNEGNLAKAKGDLKTLQAALESYYIHNSNQYPEYINYLAQVDQTFRIINAIPADPFNTNGALYGYVRGGTANRYYVAYSIGPYVNGAASINTTDGIDETNESCIFISNAGDDVTGP